MRTVFNRNQIMVATNILSEEPGLQWLVEWPKPQLPGYNTTHIPSMDAFSWA